MAFCFIHLLQVRIIANGFNALLQRNDFIIAGHHHHGAELKPFTQVHGQNRHMAAGGLDMLVQHLKGQSSRDDCSLRSRQLRL